MSNNTKVHYWEGGNQEAQLRSLMREYGGCLKVHQDHVIPSMLPKLQVPVRGTDVKITMHILEYLSLEDVIFSSEVDAMPARWFINP